MAWTCLGAQGYLRLKYANQQLSSNETSMPWHDVDLICSDSAYPFHTHSEVFPLETDIPAWKATGSPYTTKPIHGSHGRPVASGSGPFLISQGPIRVAQVVAGCNGSATEQAKYPNVMAERILGRAMQGTYPNAASSFSVAAMYYYVRRGKLSREKYWRVLSEDRDTRAKGTAFTAPSPTKVRRESMYGRNV